MLHKFDAVIAGKARSYSLQGPKVILLPLLGDQGALLVVKLTKPFRAAF